jgi:hypothetical protein
MGKVEGTPMQSTVLPVTDRYREAIYFSLRQQVPWALLSLLFMDGGNMARICAIAMLGYSAVLALMLIRRPHSPTSFDIMFLRWGFFPLYSLVFGLGVALRNSA